MNSIIQKSSQKPTHSSYWLGGAESPLLTQFMNESQLDSHKMFKLTSGKKAIANFVQIVTNQSIPVTFNTKSDSYTDGKQVVIGSNIIEPHDFDVAVGLALHEGSHIKLSDFDLLKRISSLIPTMVTDTAIKMGILNTQSIVKDLWNWVEDRRIDSFIYEQAPGYRGYYQAMYGKYFNSPAIDKGLLSDEYRTETIDSYFFRIINLHNKNSQLDALVGLKEIHKLVDFKNILRLKSSKDAFDIALGIFKIMLKSLIVEQKAKEDEAKENGEGDDSGESGEGSGGGGDDSENTLTDEQFDDLLKSVEDMETGTGSAEGQSVEIPADDTNGDSTTNEAPKNPIKLTKKQKELLKKAIEKQKEFMDGETSDSKDQLSKKDSKKLDTIAETGSELKTVGGSVEQTYGSGTQRPIQVVTVKRLTQTLLESDDFPLVGYGVSKTYQAEVDKGIQLGFMLGKKLQIRSESRTTVFNRQKVGKIDKRMIASLGFGNENVFQFNDVDSYKKANIHISIDASGSMDGKKWRETMINTVAMCKAVDMIAGLEIQVTYRTTIGGRTSISPLLPYVVMAYDSRVDKLTKVKSMFPTFEANGVTPEGLCFEAILKEFIPADTTIDSYFINISDGSPWFANDTMTYEGDAAHNHTKAMVKKIQGMGIKVLSYFVSDYSTELSAGFKKMYGKTARSVDITNIGEITKTVNSLFLTK